MARPTRENVERCMKGLRGEKTEVVTETVLWADVCEAYLAALDVVDAAKRTHPPCISFEQCVFCEALRELDEGKS
jgi:hypothetical protein